MSQKLPLLFRAALAAERFRHAAEHLHTMLEEEVLWAFSTPEQREAANRIHWGTATSYLPGGSMFKVGLFDWEWRAITESPFPKSGRILLGGAGGGRELLALCEMGFDVVAFEPSALWEGARQVASAFPKSTVVRASYADLVATVKYRTGPLAAHVLDASFDAVILGWTTLNHVFTEGERRDLLCATRPLAPRAPLLLSYLGREGEDGRLDRLRPYIHRTCRLLGAPSVRRPGDVFWEHVGFLHTLTRPEIEAAAGASGYRILYLRETNGPCPYALLAPQ